MLDRCRIAIGHAMVLLEQGFGYANVVGFGPVASTF